MNRTLPVKYVVVLSVMLTAIGCDQVSKKMVRENIPRAETISYLDNHVALTYVENKGAFLSLGDSIHGFAHHLLLTIVPLVFLLGAAVFLLTRSKPSTNLLIGLSLVLGGGTGNIFDRIVYGSVTDFLYIDFYFFHTGIFNLADVCVMMGTLLIIAHAFLKRKQ